MTSKRKKYWGNNPKFKQQRTTNSQYENRFQELSDNDDSVSDESEFRELAVKIPPIIVDSIHSFSNVIKLLGENCKYKRMSVGTKVMPNTLAIYEDIIKHLQEKGITFYTHPVKDQNKFKLILFGLPQMNTKAILDEIKATFNIEPINIKEITTARTTADDAIYMLEFNRNQVSKREIFRIKYIHSIAIHWRNPLRSSKGPTQCSKCAMYGHGASNCYRKNNCIGCGGPHDYSTCPLNKTTAEGPVVYKCFNCVKKNLKNVNHRADDVRCPSRREYLEIREKVSRNRPNVSFSNRPQFNFSPDDFPGINQNTYIPNNTNAWPSNLGNNENTAPRPSTSATVSRDDNLSNEKILEIYF